MIYIDNSHEKKTEFVPNFLKMRTFLSTLANNSHMLTKNSHFENIWEKNVFFFVDPSSERENTKYFESICNIVLFFYYHDKLTQKYFWHHFKNNQIMNHHHIFTVE